MHNLFKQLACVVAATILSATSLSAAGRIKHASMVIDANTGEVLQESYADAPRHPASLTKIMTIYMAFCEIAAGRLNPASPIRISERAASAAPSKLDLAPGEEIALLDAIKALVTKSANDVAIAIAENIGGSEANFVQLMNARAKQIGMTRTNFVNASGLPDDDQISTARDMLTLALHIQDEFPEQYRLFSLKEFTFGGKTYRTHNTLMHSFPGMDGVKTGYTRASGFNLVSSVHAGNKHLVAAVFGGETAATRNAYMRSLLFRGLEKASTRRTRQPAKTWNPMVASAPLPQPAKRIKTVANLAPPAPKPVVARLPQKAAAPLRLAAAQEAPARAKDEIAAIIGPAETRPQQPSAYAEPSKANPLAKTAETGTLSFRPSVTADNPAPAASATPRPASTLDAQAAHLAAAPNQNSRTAELPKMDAAPNAPKERRFVTAGVMNPPSQPAHLNGPRTNPTIQPASAQATAPTSATTKQVAAEGAERFEVQIGAYGTEHEAREAIMRARIKAAKVLDGHDGITMPTKRGEKEFHRARFTNFDDAKAQRTCSELRRAAIDCFIMKQN